MPILQGLAENSQVQQAGAQISASLQEAGTQAVTQVTQQLMGTFNSTLGAVISNGFNLSCWGASDPPSETKGWAQKDLPAVLNATLGKGITHANVQLFVDVTEYMYVKALNQSKRMNSCSAKGWKNYSDAAKKFQIDTMAQLPEFTLGAPYQIPIKKYKGLFSFSHRHLNDWSLQKATTYDSIIVKYNKAVETQTTEVPTPVVNDVVEEVLQETNYNTNQTPTVQGSSYYSTEPPLNSGAVYEGVEPPKGFHKPTGTTNKKTGFPWWLILIPFIG